MRDDKPEISVIVPVYKVEKYVSKCIDSIMAQTFEDIEIILVDDGSPDNCGKICDAYAEKDSRIRVIHKENGGLSDARNAGIDAARGGYISFVDSDDYIAPDMMEKLYNAINSSDADMSICNYLYVDENGNEVYDNDNLPIKDEVVSGVEILTNKMLEHKGWYWVISCCKLYKKEIFSGLRFIREKQHEDEFIIHEVLVRCGKVAGVSDALYYYVQREGSIMNKRETSVKILDAVEAMMNRIELLYKLDCDPYVAYWTTTVAVDNICISLKKVDYRNRENRTRYKEILDQFNKTTKKMTKTLTKKLSPDRKVKLVVFRILLRLLLAADVIGVLKPILRIAKR